MKGDSRTRTGKDVFPTKTVYCYYFPEVRAIIDEIVARYPHDVFLRSIAPGLDDFHHEAIRQYCAHMKTHMPGLESFPYRYTSAGASESIFHILANIASFRKETPLYILEGEYEGYAGYGGNLGLSFVAVSEDVDFKNLSKGIFFLSNPSARDGNIIDNAVIEAIAEGGHEIILDATYVGLTAPHIFLADHPSISAVLVSLSKPFGLYYYRIGFCFSRKEYLTLHVNKWFKNIFSHSIAEKTLSRLKPSELALTYHAFQQRAVDTLSERYGIPVQSSDVALLAHIPAKNVPPSAQKEIEQFRRGPYYRFCLTPFFLAYEQESKETV